MRQGVMQDENPDVEELTGGSLKFAKGLNLYWHGGLFCF